MTATAQRSGARAIAEALAAELDADPSVMLLGEETARGGLFGVTAGFGERYGKRIHTIAHDEAMLVGAAIGMALVGLRPVVELLLADHLGPAWQQLAGELANLRYATGGELTAPVTVRVPVGRLNGGPRQSLSPEALLASAPGLVVVAPSDPAAAHALLRAAIRSDDPVVFLEPVSLYGARTSSAAGPVTLGRARVVRPGDDVSVFCWGGMVARALAAAEAVAGEGVAAEVIDLQTLSPLDVQAIVDGAARTGRAVVVSEGSRTGGFGAEVAATIAEGALETLEAPVLRVAAADAPAPCRGSRHGAVDVARIADAIRETVDYQ